jgi:hypothetical protein
MGRTYRPSDDLLDFSAAYAAEISRRTPTGQPGVFAPPIAVVGTDTWLDALRHLGRDPASH